MPGFKKCIARLCSWTLQAAELRGAQRKDLEWTANMRASACPKQSSPYFPGFRSLVDLWMDLQGLVQATSCNAMLYGETSQWLGGCGYTMLERLLVLLLLLLLLLLVIMIILFMLVLLLVIIILTVRRL